MITKTLFIFGCCLTLGLTFPADETPTLEVVQAKEIHLPQQVLLTKDVVKEPFLPTPTPTEAALNPELQAQLVETPARIAPPLTPAEPTEEQGEDLSPPLDATQNVGDKTDLETANTFWGGYGGYGGYGGWGWRRPSYYGGWGRGWGGGWGGYGGGYGGYGWGGRSYYRPWGWGGLRW